MGIVALDIGGTTIKYGIWDGEGLSKINETATDVRSPKALIAQVERIVRTFGTVNAVGNLKPVHASLSNVRMAAAFCEMPAEIVGLALDSGSFDRITWTRINNLCMFALLLTGPTWLPHPWRFRMM